MTVVITIHLFQAVYNGHGCFGRFWEIAGTYVFVMVNGHYIHFYKNKYNKLTPILLIHLFISATHARKCEWMEQPALLPWNGAISIKISLISLFTPTYFAVAASHSELKPTRTFTVMHGKV